MTTYLRQIALMDAGRVLFSMTIYLRQIVILKHIDRYKYLMYSSEHMFELPKLTYSYDALEPYIDAQTMEIHHSKHHAAYIANLNRALEPHPDLQKMAIEDLIKNLNNTPKDIRTAIRNNGGGHYNHSLFWKLITPTARGKVPSKLDKKISADFGTFSTFKEIFTKTALGRFGSGWAWLVVENDKLAVLSTPNQDNPISEGRFPILGLDVWEHAYYLKYQSRRAEYIEAWWNVVDWKQVEAYLLQV